MSQIKSFLKGFMYAARGFGWMVLNERNFRVHLTCLVYMIYFLARYDYFVVSRTECAILILASALVIGSEMINSGIEKADDSVTKEKLETIKISKDVSAGAVLVFAVAAVLVGISILWQPQAFEQLFNHFYEKPIAVVSFVISLAVSFLFIFKLNNLKNKGNK